MTERHRPLPTLRIGSIELPHPFVQAALSGYSDWPMRALAKQYGAAYTIAEVMIDRFATEVKGQRNQDRHFRVCDNDHPVGGQLMGSDPELFESAAMRLVDAGFDVIDINFGCPVKSAVGGCRGGYHLGHPSVAIDIVRTVRDAVPDEIPVTVKMRRGIDASDESRDKFFAILEAAYQAGVAAVTVHGRTVEQKYRGPSDWSFLSDVKRFAGDRIVLGSGDLFTPQACVDMIRQTNVDGVTIARGAIGNPWIFQQAIDCWHSTDNPLQPTVRQQRSAIEQHYQYAIAHDPSRAVGAIRKFGFKYARLHPLQTEVRQALGGVRTAADLQRLLDEFYISDAAGIEPIVDEAQC